jgi:hypothetical protein
VLPVEEDDGIAFGEEVLGRRRASGAWRSRVKRRSARMVQRTAGLEPAGLVLGRTSGNAPAEKLSRKRTLPVDSERIGSISKPDDHGRR